MGRDRASRPDAAPLRLFVAIDVAEAAKDAVDEAFRPWREEFPRARWVPRENWHVTLKFLGRTWPRLREWVPERVEAAVRDVPSFPIRLAGVGSFPSRRRGRVLWAGVDDADRLAEVATRLDEALRDEFEPEARPFHAHLTVARSDPPVQLPPAYAETPLGTAPWTVREVVLYRSHLRRPAPVYEPIARVPLGGEQIDV
jgi:RNA 2',3'-cyclic 3'-phosphodiesterase